MSRVPGIPVNFRLSPEGVAILEGTAAELGITKTAVMEIALRRLRQAGRRPREKSAKKSR